MYKHWELRENAKLSARKTKISSFYFNKKKTQNNNSKYQIRILHFRLWYTTLQLTIVYT